MFLNIITPCSRPNNLKKIKTSINIPKEKYRWIIVHDSEIMPDNSMIPENCEFYLHKNSKSIFGNSQRNYGLDMVNEGHVYFHDDDTVIHEDLWETIKDLDNDFIHFEQSHPNGNIRVSGIPVEVGNIDSHNFIVCSKIAKQFRWRVDIYDEDGYFAVNCYGKSENPKYIKKVLSIYNFIRKNII